MEYVIVDKGGRAETEEKKSRFIATVEPVSSEEEAVDFVTRMKKQYWDARHNCSAYIIGDNGEKSRCSDDGEPSGTAGRPMLDVLTKRGITNVCVVVTRYFGGVLLGTGGLVRAYSSAVSEGLKNCTFARNVHGYRVVIRCEYNDFEKVRRICTQRCRICDISYGSDVEITIETPKADELIDRIEDATSGRTKASEPVPAVYTEPVTE